MFIARVSKGRTIREFIVAVLLIPTLVTLVGMSVFGGLAVEQVINEISVLGQNGITDFSLAMFQMFDSLVFCKVLSVIAVVLVLVLLSRRQILVHWSLTVLPQAANKIHQYYSVYFGQYSKA